MSSEFDLMKIQVENINMKLDDRASTVSNLNYMIYAILETIPHAKEKYNELEEAREFYNHDVIPKMKELSKRD